MTNPPKAIYVDVPANGIHAALEKMHVDGYTTKTVAEAVGVSTMTISRWRKAGLVTPRLYRQGKATVYIFSAEDIKTCQDIHKRLRPGRRKLGDESVRVTKPPDPPSIGVVAQQRHARLAKARRDRIRDSKAITEDEVQTSVREGVQ